MPYADPEKKREYMKKYNREWYAENKEPRNLIQRNIDRKRDLRSNKSRFILETLGEYCPACGGTETGDIKLHIVAETTSGKSLGDYSWPQLKLLLGNGKISLICSTCKYIGKPEENHL